ncbi:MAG: DUF3052 family protein [Saprospiraceae bacterium]|nr:DUF3052 family protein [Saprospiraceae bacterium]
MEIIQSGYAQTPLAQKLGIKSGFSVLIINRPKHYYKLFSDLPSDLTFLKSGVEGEVDFIHLFVKNKEEFIDRIVHAKPLINKTGMIWVSWPKGSSSFASDLKRDFIRDYILELGLVDVKVCSIDEDWSGLKFVYRMRDR